MTIAHTQELYTDKYQKAGASYRLDFHALYVMSDGQREWHYYGSTAAQYPPTTADPVFQHAQIVFPADFIHLMDEQARIWDMAVEAAPRKAGL